VRHVGYIEVADIRAEDSIEMRAIRVGFRAERPGIGRIVRLAAEVEMRNEKIANLLDALDPTGLEIVQRSVVVCGARRVGLALGIPSRELCRYGFAAVTMKKLLHQLAI